VLDGFHAVRLAQQVIDDVPAGDSGPQPEAEVAIASATGEAARLLPREAPVTAPNPSLCLGHPPTALLGGPMCPLSIVRSHPQ